jgi:hypothetical protein
MTQPVSFSKHTPKLVKADVQIHCGSFLAVLSTEAVTGYAGWPADRGFLCGKVGVFGTPIKEKPCLITRTVRIIIIIITSCN